MRRKVMEEARRVSGEKSKCQEKCALRRS